MCGLYLISYMAFLSKCLHMFEVITMLIFAVIFMSEEKNIGANFSLIISLYNGCPLLKNKL